MQDHQNAFIELAISHQALCFGEFTLKSGRISPYFFNAGRFNTGAALATLGKCYAQTITNAGIDLDILFGPAYKGIPLATATAAALHSEHQRDYPICYNRKEAKDHGEGGTLVGASLNGRVAIIDDVITAGTAVREVIQIIEDAEAKPSAVFIGLDRQERGTGALSAIQEVEQTFNVPVFSIITLNDIIEYMKTNNRSETVEAMMKYRQMYGIDK